MVKYLSQKLDDRSIHSNHDSDSVAGSPRKVSIDLALENFLAQQAQIKIAGGSMNESFKEVAISEIRTFIFAGRDTSSTALCDCYHLLGTHPNIRNAVLEEHDRVLDPQDTQAAPNVIDNPRLLN